MAMDERRHDETETEAPAVSELVEAQLETARAEVFRAYVQARDKARQLVEDDEPRGARGRRAS